MRKSADNKSGPNLYLNSGMGGLTGFLFTLIILLIVAVLTSMGKVPEIYMKEITVIACGLGALIGSYTASRRQKGRAFLAGFGSGLAMFILTLILSLFTKSSAFFGGISIVNLITILIGGTLGGILSASPIRRRR